jgi:hypothetical protein
MHYEFHGHEVIVQQYHLIHRWAGLWLHFGQQFGVVAIVTVSHCYRI